jgi:hypothetical protein
MAQTHFTPDPPRARHPSRRRSPEHPQNPAESLRRPGSPRPRPPAPPRPAGDLNAPATRVTPSYQDPSALSPSIMTPPLMIFTPRIVPGTHPNEPKPSQAKRVSTPPCQAQPRTREQAPGAGTPATHPAHPRGRPTPRRRPTPSTTPHRGPPGGPGGRPPGRALRAIGEGRKSPEHRATPGGYGGKPPGVAFIGVPTGARNAGSDAPTGDQSIDMNRTRKHPPVCQDPITTRSRDEPEQAQSPAD